MTKRYFVANGDAYLRHASYTGCSALPSDPLDYESIYALLAKRIARWRRQGFTVDILDGTEDRPERVEVQDADDAVMVSDTAGVYSVEPFMVPAWKCWECDELTPEGETCPCREFVEPEGDERY